MKRAGLTMSVLLSMLVYAAMSDANVTLPAIIGSGMVLQSGRDVPIWGRAEPGEVVKVELCGQSKTVMAGPDGRWTVRLEPLEAGGPFEMTVSGRNVIRLSNVLVGEVWLASGQSNMAMRVRVSRDAEAEIAAAKYPSIRLFTVEQTIAHTPQEDVKGRWVEAAPETVANFSAAAFFFGRDLHAELGAPVGLVNSSWSGSLIEAWTSRGTLEALPEAAPLLTAWQNAVERRDTAAIGRYQAEFAAWTEASRQASAAGTPGPARPREPFDPLTNYQHPCVLYNGMIRPLAPFAIRGVIWYQGEGNSDRAWQYRLLFPALITDWRRTWGEGELPFLFVQLANYRAARLEPGQSNWAETREAQAMALALPRTGMAVAIDIGEAHDVHPKNKQEVGRRLALLARGVAYGQDIVCNGPTYESMEVVDGKARVAFRHVGAGLVARGRDSLNAFEVAGADGGFVRAEARIDGDGVLVWHEEVRDPAAVRYAWHDNPGEVNLYNAAGLPAGPFRTDDRPLGTLGALVWDAVRKYE